MPMTKTQPSPSSLKQPRPKSAAAASLFGMAAKGGIAPLAGVLLLVWFCQQAIPNPSTLGPPATLGFLLLGGIAAGNIAAAMGLPKLTGYLLLGVLSGPFGLAFFDHTAAAGLSWMNELALALIALQAGSELALSQLRHGAKGLTWAILFHAVVIPLWMLCSFALLSPWLHLPGQPSLGVVLALGGVWGALALAKAPADTLAILSETGAHDRFASHVLGVVVLIDVVVLVVFALALLVAKSALNPHMILSLHSLSNLGVELGSSCAAGVSFGLVVAAWFWLVGDNMRLGTLFCICSAFVVGAFCRYLHYDALLVFVAAGFIVRNLSAQGPRLLHAVESLSHGVMVVFFATAGASLNLTALTSLWPVALALALLRMAANFAASYFGHTLAHDPRDWRWQSHTAFVSQAGVTLGLANIISHQLGPAGAQVAMLAVAVVGINELIGPVVFKQMLAYRQRRANLSEPTGMEI